MTTNRQVIAGNLARVRQRIALAASRAGRSERDVRLVGVTKYTDVDGAAALLDAGCVDLAESRPQELWRKAADERLARARWHLVGHLQRNKVNQTLPLVSLIHSVDSERLLAAIDHSASKEARLVDVLLEINCSGEVSKHGLSSEDARALVAKLDRFANVRVCGLMTMARLDGGPPGARRDFARLRSLRDELQASCPSATRLSELSMGMSGDLEEAVAEGATIVRVGSALFEGLAP